MKRALPAYCAIYVIDIGIQLSNSSENENFRQSFIFYLSQVLEKFLLFVDIDNENKHEKNNKTHPH